MRTFEEEFRRLQEEVLQRCFALGRQVVHEYEKEFRVEIANALGIEDPETLRPKETVLE